MILAIDPGMAECGWARLERDTILAAGTINTSPKAGPYTRTLKVVTGLITEADGCTGIVCESFGDQGTKRNRFRHRWQTPMVIGGLVVWSHLSDISSWAWQDSAILSKNGPMRPYRDHWQAGLRGLVAGDHHLKTGHEMDAAAHGLWACWNRRGS